MKRKVPKPRKNRRKISLKIELIDCAPAFSSVYGFIIDLVEGFFALAFAFEREKLDDIMDGGAYITLSRWLQQIVDECNVTFLPSNAALLAVLKVKTFSSAQIRFVSESRDSVQGLVQVCSIRAGSDCEFAAW